VGVAQVYAVLANHGLRASPFSIKEVMTSMAVSWKSIISVCRRRCSQPRVSRHQFSRRGVRARNGRSARRIRFSLDGAGKTGTTDEERDAWFAGYTSDLLVSYG